MSAEPLVAIEAASKTYVDGGGSGRRARPDRRTDRRRLRDGCRGCLRQRQIDPATPRGRSRGAVVRARDRFGPRPRDVLGATARPVPARDGHVCLATRGRQPLPPAEPRRAPARGSVAAALRGPRHRLAHVGPPGRAFRRRARARVVCRRVSPGARRSSSSTSRPQSSTGRLPATCSRRWTTPHRGGRRSWWRRTIRR